GALVEGRNDGAGAAGQTNKLVAVHQRVGSRAPVAQFALVVAREVLRPDHLAAVGVEAKEIAHGANGVNLAIDHRRRGARPGGVANPSVDAVVFVLPEEGSGGLVEAEDALLAFDFLAGEAADGVLAPFGEDAVGYVDAAVDDRGASVAEADGRAPADLGPVLGELVEDARLAPDAVALWSQPLWPVVGAGTGCQRGEQRKGGEQGE